jgi:hypothetical protein
MTQEPILSTSMAITIVPKSNSITPEIQKEKRTIIQITGSNFPMLIPFSKYQKAF